MYERTIDIRVTYGRLGLISVSTPRIGKSLTTEPDCSKLMNQQNMTMMQDKCVRPNTLTVVACCGTLNDVRPLVPGSS